MEGYSNHFIKKKCINIKFNLYYIRKYILIKIIYILLFVWFFKIINKKKIIKEKSIFSQPKISIFLPIYNKGRYLNRSIGSIQNQSIKDIEIISVNDGSEDNTLNILSQMAKKDSRIKIVNNEKNRGLLYSRAMGIINSKGEYLMNLDPDDELEGQNTLQYLYDIANKSKLDVVSFGLIKKNSFTSIKTFMCSNFNHILFQPEIFISGSKNGDYLITNKLVKKELLIKVYEIFKSKIFGSKWNYG